MYTVSFAHGEKYIIETQLFHLDEPVEYRIVGPERPRHALQNLARETKKSVSSWPGEATSRRIRTPNASRSISDEFKKKIVTVAEKTLYSVPTKYHNVL